MLQEESQTCAICRDLGEHGTEEFKRQTEEKSELLGCRKDVLRSSESHVAPCSPAFW